ncbi:unnamed protein product [Cladocopium goreaui]|uniref:Uncharacterized protein n=1 Tax=Cladocopium goreaui TaxID=2562237 RepID=A0A9P1FF34_9DINO|nr:unnamed protein product [Cladocopium goreaui]
MMGIGKRRFHILNTAARKRETFAPFDLRFSPNRGRTIISEKRQQVFDFLHELWENVAEPIPDGLNSNKRPRHGNDKCDPKNMCRENIKHLPAGSINDYHRQCQAALKDMSVSRKLFCLVMPPKGTKRTSGGGGGGKSKAKKGSSDQLPALPAGALHLPHMAIFEEWFRFTMPRFITHEGLQRICGAYLAAVDRYAELVPAAFYQKTIPEIEKSFLHRHADADLLNVITTSVPPMDLSKVMIFNTHLLKYNSEEDKKSSDRAAQLLGQNWLSAQLLQATWGQTELNYYSDLKKLREWAQKFDLFNQQQAMMDYKYLSDRYMKGKSKVSEFMDEKHKLVSHDSLIMSHSTIVEMQGAMGNSGLTIMIFDATLWPSRALAVDEAVQLCQSVSSGNQKTIAWTVDAYEVALTFSDSVHQGIAGIVGIQGSHPWLRSKAMLGSIVNIQRDRVSELQNPEPEKPLAPHWRVQQRGVGATQAILEQLLDGMLSDATTPVLVVDLLPNRFAEWSAASWKIQREFLLGSDTKIDLRFLAVYHNDDAAFMHSTVDGLLGRAMSSWWDDCEEAGPKARLGTGFQEDPPSLEVLAINSTEHTVVTLGENQ